MKHYREKLTTLVEDNYSKNKRVQSQQADFYFTWLKDEIDEVAQELDKGNKELIEFEMADILRTTLNLIERLHQDNTIDKTTLYEKAYNKFAERLPNIAAWEAPIAKEEQDRIWNEAKKKQKKELWL